MTHSKVLSAAESEEWSARQDELDRLARLDGFVTLREYAGERGVSPQVLANAARRKTLPARKLGTHKSSPWVGFRDDLDAYLRASKRRPGRTIAPTPKR